MRKRISGYMLALLLATVLLAFSGRRVFADGGAPNLAYVAGGGQGVSIIDIGQKKVTGTFKLGGDPQSVYLSLDGRFLYVTQPTLSQISVLAAKDGHLVCTAHVPGNPSLLAYDQQTDSLFVAGNQATSISEIDVSNCVVLHAFQAGAPVSGLAVINLASSTQDNQLWVSNGTNVSIFDTKTRKELATIVMPGHAQYLSAPSGLWVYASTQEGNLYALGLSAPHQILPLLSGGTYGPMDFDEITGQIYLPDRLHRQIDQIKPPDPLATAPPHEPAFTYAFDVAPQSVAITSDGQYGFVALSNGQVAMLDIPGKEVIQTINAGGKPSFVITGLYPPVLGSTPQQASLIDTIATVAAYILVVALVLVPVWFVVRQNRKRKAEQQGESALEE